MFSTILIANRGEIACRVIRTARRLGIRTVAVFSEADAGAMHVALADEARLIGPAPARESYLRIEAIIEAALASGAEAIHPGYGFLSENAEFAEACAAAGITFIGPPPSAIRAMGSKSAAKALMERAGVPLVPGYHGEDQAPARLRAEADRIGYPLLIKASAGGGGKGMKVVENPAGLEEALALAKGEARAAFGDDHVLLERYLTQPRHIEIQVFADNQGNTVHLFERDCSIQRRHQKVVEEAPAPGMDPARREAMGRAACEAARAIGYVGAGTVEFIAEGDTFAFMEMNTRLQVEHPVTEAITGQDLVEWQLRVAAGGPLPLAQEDLRIGGHAVEVRLYAEDPARDFAPSIGRVEHLRFPEGEGIRIDTGIRGGDAVTVHYDPMIAKIIAHGPDRAAAVARMARALDATELSGPATNLALLRAIVAQPAFREGALDTGFIARHAETLLAPAGPAPRAALAAAVARLLLDRAAAPPADAADPHSPWGSATAWRLNGAGHQDFTFGHGEATHTLRAHPRDGGFRLDLPDGAAEVAAAEAPDGRILLRVDGRALSARVLRAEDRLTVLLPGSSHALRAIDPLAPAGGEGPAAGRILAPMPGRVLEVLVTEGQAVVRGAVLLVLEAMKVQMRITAPAEGTVSAILCAPGELVEDGVELVSLSQNGAG
ncbi:acetyl/propionyl/methylcrotonyl-CoA carboxylase subunit alpha [Pararoseomonas indoligenes]|uniref:Acetyl/propionyl/methylcrotonyl-CoA carboxylase subunit alpha n=1 Tax=Roseomonas indoligenes TaxID=2820811 RepID=A0A940MXW0_9PROT|nr:acetyl/propionyl/methylcrotonyl-CoA carboxylase subunit alpha [Pararoseomonas indoligenes]MBP0491750.1 acetyl/propionyl/methylcrotonyl-CoA carboxylase subunit alpha [Pararoseomonas indoligenes]